jgi:hypothetical protein
MLGFFLLEKSFVFGLKEAYRCLAATVKTPTKFNPLEVPPLTPSFLRTCIAAVEARSGILKALSITEGWRLKEGIFRRYSIDLPGRHS